MYRRYGFILIASSLLASGCTQTVRHTNTLLFATNTQIAISAGTSATAQPDITIGYKRQEAVVMPLVANYAPDPKEPGKLVPCGNATSPPADGCLIVGKNGTSGAQDSYSVLASFGAKFGGKSSGTTPEASVGIAQYFATGVAAQLLAATGGASIISTAKPEPASLEKAATVASVMDPVNAQKTVLGVANYEKAFKDGYDDGTGISETVSRARACFRDPVKAEALVIAIDANEAMKSKKGILTAALAGSDRDLVKALDRNGDAFREAFSNWIKTKC